MIQIKCGCRVFPGPTSIRGAYCKSRPAPTLHARNQVRDRAGLAGYTGLTKNDTREKIYLERRLELSFEGVRWFDLVRTGRAFSTMQPYGMQEFMTVFPLPLSQIQLINNPSIFPQNKGYE